MPTEREIAGGMAELRKFVAPEFVVGHGALELAGRYTRRLGAHRVLLVSDAGVHDAGWTDCVAEALQAAGVEVCPFLAVTPNPRITEVMAGAELYRQEQCDGIVVIGGGSPIDCAKGIGVVVANGGDIRSYEGVDQILAPMPPVVAIPTTAGTGADVSQFAILSDRDAGRKLALISKALVPDVALVDPATLTTLSPFLRACTGIDALVHAIEAFVSTGNSPVTDLHAREAIRMIGRHLLPGLDGNATAHDVATMEASLHAGLAFSNASLGLVHAMSHALGGRYDLPHGECNALLLEHVLEFNFRSEPQRYREIGLGLGFEMAGTTLEQGQRALLDGIRALRQAAGIGRTLRQAGVESSEIGQLARHALQDACIVTNPRQPNQRDIEVIYECAL